MMYLPDMSRKKPVGSRSGAGEAVCCTDSVTKLWYVVDERVLRWVLSLPSTFDPSDDPRLNLEQVEPKPVQVPELEGLDSEQVDDSLRRLRSAALIDGKESGSIDANVTYHTGRGAILTD